MDSFLATKYGTPIIKDPEFRYPKHLWNVNGCKGRHELQSILITCKYSMEQSTKPQARRELHGVGDIRKSAAPKSGRVAARVAAFVTVFCLVAALAVLHNGSLFGKSAGSFFSSGASGSVESRDSVSPVRYSGTQMIINTTDIGRDISGYGGPVPLEIYVTQGKIDSVVALGNSESPKFFGRLETSGLTRAWNGMTLK